jgi:dissimilatory sulfite reductase (desulfoviridin) alpha/beta subunit
MEIDKMYLRGLIDATVQNYENCNGAICETKNLQFELEDYYGSQTKPIGVKITIAAICDKKRTPLIYDGTFTGMDEDPIYYEQEIIIYKSDKLASVISDLEDELTKIDEFKID